jgi:hypothetical protein
MKTPAAEAKRPRWPLVLAIVGPPVLIAGVFVPMLLVGAETQRGNLWVGATPYGPISRAPAADVRAVLHALHDIGAQCLKPTPDPTAIESDVTIITGFAQLYPVGRFPIDDETATASSLLIVTREAVKNCSPGQVAVIKTTLNRTTPH